MYFKKDRRRDIVLSQNISYHLYNHDNYVQLHLITVHCVHNAFVTMKAKLNKLTSHRNES